MPKLQKRKLNLEEDVLQDYIYYCQERDLRPQTILVYEKSLKLFFKFLQEEFKIVMLEDVQEKHIREYLKFTKERGKYSYVTNLESVSSNKPANRRDFGKQISSKTLDGYPIAPCIFSRDFENILSQEYIDSLNNFRNVTLIGGAGEGTARKKTTIGYAEGLNRFELFTDAKDISDKKIITIQDEEGVLHDIEVTMPWEEYEPLLKQRGNEKIAECTEIKTFESEVNTRGNNIYKVDYDLGDIVTVTDKKWSLTIDTRITEIEEVYENGNININPTFGNVVPTLIDKIKRMVR